MTGFYNINRDYFFYLVEGRYRGHYKKII